ncbi:MAG: sigma-70 family RNA polymerase sigma factor [Kofleriaceae bacterium]|nr:sigma-70 family RNA polymerase sigma factor [Kofleriaceae bacterium]
MAPRRARRRSGRRLIDLAPSPAEVADRQRARAVLDRILDAMDDDLRAVFVLYELEELTMSEIANTLELTPGTVASRLRRARAVPGQCCALAGNT